jgi:hypothetical protein
MTDESARTERFTDEEAAFLRHVRFGALPPRVPNEDLIEGTETEARRDAPAPEPPSAG